MPAALSRDPDVLRAHSRDVSGLTMTPDAVARPSSIEEVVEVIRDAGGAGTSVTAAGSQTSTTGASITDRGVLLSLRAMNCVIDVDPVRRIARAQPGATVADVDKAAAEHGLLFAPDPTSEHEASIGGSIACNASGARSLRYGATRPHVHAVTAVLADGSIGRYDRVTHEKNTVGYMSVQQPVDWFVGSEGTLGIIVEAELRLVSRPASITGLAVPFPSESHALDFLLAARQATDDPTNPIAAQCLEYFDDQAFAISRKAAADGQWGKASSAMLYLEQAVDDTADMGDLLGGWLALAETHGANEGDIRVYDSDSALREARRLRHAVPAYMHEQSALAMPRGGRRVSTDWAVPFARLRDAIAFSRAASAKAGIPQPATFGHGGNGHPHQNWVARDADDLARIMPVVYETLRYVISIGGTVAAEHGLGKLKRDWLGRQLSGPQVEVMRAIKHALDPKGMLAPGNVFAD